MKFPKRLLLPGLAALTAACLLTACCNDYDRCRSDQNGGYYEGNDSYRDGKRVEFSGKVYYDRSEGGHYMLMADNGRHYHPMNLPRRFRRDGMRVHVSGVKHGRAMEGRAWALDIENIERQ
jgi:hypothetical protein